MNIVEFKMSRLNSQYLILGLFYLILGLSYSRIISMLKRVINIIIYLFDNQVHCAAVMFGQR